MQRVRGLAKEKRTEESGKAMAACALQTATGQAKSTGNVVLPEIGYQAAAVLGVSLRMLSNRATPLTWPAHCASGHKLAASSWPCRRATVPHSCVAYADVLCAADGWRP